MINVLDDQAGSAYHGHDVACVNEQMCGKLVPGLRPRPHWAGCRPALKGEVAGMGVSQMGCNSNSQRKKQKRFEANMIKSLTGNR